MNFYFYVLIVVVFFTFLNLKFGKTYHNLPSWPSFVMTGLILFVVFSIAFSPIEVYGDKYNYLAQFKNFSYASYSSQKDLGWAFYNHVSQIIYDSSALFFLITAFIYIVGYYVFIKKTVPPRHRFFLFLACVSSFGFLTYGINTIRAGFSLSLLLIAISYHKKKFLFILLSICAVLSHKSIALPLFAYVLTGYYNRPNFYLKLWLFALLISLINIGGVSEIIQTILGDFDERGNLYLSDKNLQYKTGFRVDFVAYSIIPIIAGNYFINKQGIKENLYTRLFNLYLFVNAFWLLNIRMNFSDRMAYLSWFLIPFILLLPLLKYNLEISNRNFVAFILVGIIAFSAIMHFIL
ncbi:EpsG family protein [Mesonia sediminis]|uniref:EpsG family protein n=1 Tax=Mesonia sediminis TaxID=1703946 RepID=A0ABW5SH80_9FLAO